jgi:hypothetical protein
MINKKNLPKQTTTENDGSIPQQFQFFRETPESDQHSPRGEERAQLVPYFFYATAVGVGIYVILCVCVCVCVCVIFM